MKYKAYLRQSGEGCDYTIGCGRTVISIEASDIIEAMEKLHQIIEEDYSGNETNLSQCVLYEVSDVVVCDLKKLYDDIENQKHLKEEQRIENQERKLYEKLKNKFE